MNSQLGQEQNLGSISDGYRSLMPPGCCGQGDGAARAVLLAASGPGLGWAGRALISSPSGVTRSGYGLYS